MKSLSIYMVGIKGTGMTALAELLVSMGARVQGSDVADQFYTDAILAELNIKVFQGFSNSNVPLEVDLVVHSAAWDPKTHTELLRARECGHTIVEYTEALGQFSATLDSSGVAGVHGKTTTTALVGTLVKELKLAGSVLVGSGVSNFGGRQTLCQGREFFVAETCEYRRHFMHFHPKRLILTSVEEDHLDYFKDYDDIAKAFFDYALLLPSKGELIYCSDDAGACDVASRVAKARPDINLIPYGFTAEGPYKMTSYTSGNGTQSFTLEGLRGFNSSVQAYLPIISLQIPGKHNARNACAALALINSLDKTKSLESKIAALGSFTGTRRRSEVIGERNGVLVLDDYGHHPSAIRTTLAGFREFYPGRRLVLSFMSHTYSRTAGLLDEFSTSFGDADEVLLHKIYASAREEAITGINGQTLFEKTKNHHGLVHYYDDFMDSLAYLDVCLKPGDIFITMGAGDNWKLGKAWLNRKVSSAETQA